MKIISASIDLSKIDKNRIIHGEKGGKFYNISVIVKDEVDKYGRDVQITEGQSKEEREAKKDRVFIGGGKTVYNSEVKQDKPQETKHEGDLPF